MKKWSIKIFGIVAMTSLVCLMSMGIVGAYDQDDLDRLLQQNHCQMCNLSGADLSGKDLSTLNLFRSTLTNANLSNANLSNAQFVGADLRGANLSNANLTGAYFIQADLRGANLSGATFDNANFSGAKSWFRSEFICTTPSIGGCYPECRPGGTCY